MRRARSPLPMEPEAEARYSRYKGALRVSGLTDADLARRLEVSRQQLNGVITGRERGTALWPRIAKALKVDPAWLLTGNGEPPRWAPGNEIAGAVALLDVAATLVKQSGKPGSKAALAAIETAMTAVGKLS